MTALRSATTSLLPAALALLLSGPAAASPAAGNPPQPARDATGAAAGPASASESEQRFLSCIRHRESRGDYRAVSHTGRYFGAYQFDQRTWNAAARHSGREALLDVRPDRAKPAEQDAMALSLYRWHGATPWGRHCRR